MKRTILQYTMIAVVCLMALTGCKMIGPEGGTITQEGVTISIPAGVLDQSTRLSVTTIEADTSMLPGTTLKVFELSPDGVEFVPGTVVDPYEYTDLVSYQEAIDVMMAAPMSNVTLSVPGFSTANLVLVTRVGVNWRFVEDTIVVFDEGTGTYTMVASLYHFSDYAIIDHKVVVTPTTWHSDLPYDAAKAKIDGLKAAWELATSDTDEKYTTYLNNSFDADAPDSLKFEPVGPKSCDYAADMFMSELKANPAVNDTYDITTVNSGVIFLERSQPIPHYVVRLTPKDGIGPEFLVDRYTFPGLHQIKDELLTSDQDTETYNFLETMLNLVLESYFVVETFVDPESILNHWESELVEPEPVVPGPSNWEDTGCADHCKYRGCIIESCNLPLDYWG